ncbi:MAG: ComEA family DNA-binding protein [Proteobacteria bacterium]|nr:ComEA family DNA-binding protein [Pseudomonadota bacterium]MCP4918347.1 ComEA family DNA-binding protein [Pseudomonadota bacterium]
MLLVSLLSLGTLTGCNAGNRDHVSLDWKSGETFHVGTFYKQAANKTEESALADLDGGEPDKFDTEAWSDEVVWTFQVVETNLKPKQNDELYDFSVTATGETTSLSVVRAYLDDTLNDDDGMLDRDPVVYLVFREDRDRLAGIVSFEYDADGNRVESAYSTNELGRSWNALSQSMLTEVPTYLAPYSATWETSSTTLENGSLLDSVEVDKGIVDTFFDDELGGGLVAARYEDGEPWPTWVVSDSMEATLLTEDEVSTKRAARPYMLPEAPEDFDYRAALATAIDMDAALVLDTEMVTDGGWDSQVYDEFTPWAGSWWKLSEGALVFGYDNRDTYSDRIKDEVDPIKKDMDELSNAIRDMEDGAEKDAKREEYSAKQKELVTILVDYYNGLRQDLDGGIITVADGKMTHTNDNWSYELDELSPMDKFALKMYFDDSMPGNNPFFLSAWEILNSYNPAGGSWWGHCNGWAAAAILTNEPTESMDVTIGGQNVELTTADQKGLLTESHYSTNSRFYGGRYYKEGDDIADLYPKAFTNIISFYLKDQRVPLVFDTTAGDAVWNFPAYAADVDLTETTPEGAESLVNINTASVEELDALPGVGPSKGTSIVEYREFNGPFQSLDELEEVSGIGPSTMEDVRPLITIDAFQRTFDVTASVKFATDGVSETHVDSGDEPEGFTKTYNYTLTTDADGLVTGNGTWDDDNEHPDFAWVPYSNPTWEGNGSSENPFLPYGTLVEVLGDDVERK